ncbi:MAG: hypothetical protein HFI75_04730 [Lachnospiraceae bacterium]|nr:hypothetical protein [Lachnospiraceae bacterium]
MIYGWNMLYQALEIYAGVDKEQQFAEDGGMWEDRLRMKEDLLIYGSREECFYQKVEWMYDVRLDKEIRKLVVTVGDLKRWIRECSECVM